MKRCLIVLFSLFVVPVFAELPELIEKLYPSVVVVQAVKVDGNRQEGKIGAGVMVDSRGYFLTSLHNVATYRDPNISVDGVNKIPVEIEAKSEENDLVLLKAKLPENFVGKPWTPAHTFKYQLGVPVVTIGHPMGNLYSVNKGIISGLNRRKKVATLDFTLHQTDAAINPGNSGGPVFTEKGEWVGLAFGIEPNAHGMGYFLPIKVVHEFLTAHLKLQ